MGFQDDFRRTAHTLDQNEKSENYTSMPNIKNGGVTMKLRDHNMQPHECGSQDIKVLIYASYSHEKNKQNYFSEVSRTCRSKVRF